MYFLKSLLLLFSKGPRVQKPGFGIERDFVPLLQRGRVSEKTPQYVL